MTFDEMIAVLQAARAGKAIQVKDKFYVHATWTLVDSPDWNFYNYDYRVKPEPREWLISACTLDYMHQAHPRRTDDQIKVREVLE